MWMGRASPARHDKTNITQTKTKVGYPAVKLVIDKDIATVRRERCSNTESILPRQISMHNAVPGKELHAGSNLMGEIEQIIRREISFVRWLKGRSTVGRSGRC